jgi:hypothetical protein
MGTAPVNSALQALSTTACLGQVISRATIAAIRGVMIRIQPTRGAPPFANVERTNIRFRTRRIEIENRMVKLLMMAIGFGTSFIAVREVILSIRRGSFRARGGRTVKRSTHPIMFWLNFGGLAIVRILGLGFILFSLLLLQ